MARTRKIKGKKYPDKVESGRGAHSEHKPDSVDNSKVELERKESSSKAEEIKDSREPIANKAMNDPAWYMQYPELAVDSGSIPYSQPLGAPLHIRKTDGYLYGKDGDGAHDIVSNVQVKDDSVPGILSLCVKHSIGYSKDKSDAVNVAANALYTNVRFVNSGRKNYDPADLFMYCLTMAEMYSFIEWCKRLYGMAFVYSQQNKYLGKALIEANNVDADNLVSNLANFRMFINTFINKVSSYAIPNGIPYFSRRVFMYSSIYTESNTGNIKDQLYEFIPAGFFKFGLDEVGAGELHFDLLGNRYDETVDGIIPSTGKIEVSQIINYAQRFLDYIAGDEDFGLMSGDILKAYDGNIITLSVLEPEYIIVPVYDVDVLRQFRNANIVHSLCAGTNNDYRIPLNDANDKFGRCGNISQSAATGNILCVEAIKTYNMPDIVGNTMNKILDIDSPAPTVADNLEMSRLVNYGDWRKLVPPTGGNDPVDAIVIHAGTEIPVYAKISYIQCNRNTYNEVKHIIMKSPVLTHNTGAAYPDNDIELVVAINKFHYAPMMFRVTVDSATEDTYYIGDISVMQNLDNYVTIDEENIKKMHDCALLSMFFAPGVAKVVSVTR